MVVSILDDSLHIAAAHELGDHIGLAFVLAQVEHSDDVGMGAEAAHGLGFLGDAGAGDFVQTLGLDEGEGHLGGVQVKNSTQAKEARLPG